MVRAQGSGDRRGGGVERRARILVERQGAAIDAERRRDQGVAEQPAVDMHQRHDAAQFAILERAKVMAQLVNRMRHLVMAAARQARSLAPGARPTRWNQLR